MMQTTEEILKETGKKIDKIYDDLVLPFKEAPQSQHTAMLVYSLATITYRINMIEEKIDRLAKETTILRSMVEAKG